MLWQFVFFARVGRVWAQISISCPCLVWRLIHAQNSLLGASELGAGAGVGVGEKCSVCDVIPSASDKLTRFANPSDTMFL